MRAILEDNKWIWFTNITEAEEQVLWNEFSVAIPNKRSRFIDPDLANGWDGVYRKYNRAKKRIARPLLGLLRQVCNKHDLPLSIVDERPEWPYKIIDPEEVTPDFLPGIKLDPHQIRSIQAACKIECGIVDVPTGGGKGEIIAGICKAISCPTVIIADQRIVVEQLKSRLELRDVIDDVGMFYAGEKPDGQQIIVGTIQSLSCPSSEPAPPERNKSDTDKSYNAKLDRWGISMRAYKTRRKNTKRLQEYIKKAEMVLIDECDKATSKPFKNVFRNWFKGRRRYGFSGTPFDDSKPVENFDMQENLGSVIARETRQELQKIGRIIPIHYYMLMFGDYNMKNDRSAYDIAYDEWLVDNNNFHLLIANICKKYKGDGTLVLVDRERLGNNLEEAIRSVGLTANFICGKTDKKRRNEKLREFERREFDVLIGGKIINRGLDLNGGCENLIIATGGKLGSDLIQKVGRAVRHNKRGSSRVFDFFFYCNKYLYEHSRARLGLIVKAGCDTTVVFPGRSIDGDELINRRFRIDKKWLSRSPSK